MHDAAQEPMEQGFDVKSILNFARRHYRLLLLFGLLGLVGAYAALQFIPVKYSASATLMMNTRPVKVAPTDSVVAPRPPSDTILASEAAVIMSPSVLKRVVAELKLVEDVEFIAATKPSLIARARRAASGLFSGGGGEPETPPGETEAVEWLIENLEVRHDPAALLISVGFVSADPQRAADIANAVVRAYLAHQLEGRFETLQTARRWLGERLAQLRAQLIASEQALQDFKSQHNLLDVDGGSLDEKQLARLVEELVLAKAKTAEAKARYDQIRRFIDGSDSEREKLVDLLQAEILNEMKKTLIAARQEEARLVAQFGAEHPSVKALRSQRRDIEAQLVQEARRYALALKGEYEVALAREQSLQQSLDALAAQAQAVRQATVRLREMKIEVDANNASYQAFLARMNETAAQESLQAAEFQVVSPATAPAWPSQPKKKFIWLIGVVGGLGLGFGLSLLREFFDTTIRKGETIERRFGIPNLALVPKVGGARVEAVEDGASLEAAARDPASAYANSLTTLHASLFAAPSDPPLRTLLFTSALPDEGKTKTAANFALTASRMGQRALLIDADLRKPAGRSIAPFKPGLADLVDYLDDDAAIEAAVRSLRDDGVDAIPAFKRSDEAPALLRRRKMRDLLDWAAQRYDVVVIDTPPVTVFPDACLLFPHIDGVILTLVWGKTTTANADDAVKIINFNRGRLLGSVINKVDPLKASLYGIENYADQYAGYVLQFDGSADAARERRLEGASPPDEDGEAPQLAGEQDGKPRKTAAA